MKKPLLITLTGLLCLSGLASALDIPRTVHRTKDIAKASEEAAASKRGILWVLSDSNLKPT